MSGSFHSLKAFKKFFLDGHQIIDRLYWIPILSSGVQHLLGLRICGCNIIVSKSALAVGGENLKEMVGKERKKTILDEIANIDANEQERALSSDLVVQRALFHKVANGRRNRNFIKFLENESGLVLDNSESITEEILLYFKKLYSSPPGESWRVEGIDWSPISEESASRLDSLFSEVEIYNVIFQLNRDKASGPDGFTIAMFQDCWDVIKDDLVRVFAEFHNSGIINQNTNASFIVLLPKKILIANEIVDEKRRSGEEGVVFKIDFEKAYDHVKWDFLDHVLKKKGFSSKWRKWMRGCLLSVSYAILVNDVLSRMLLKAEERSLLKGFNLPLGENPTACGFWDPVIERISRRLDGFLLQWLQKLRGCKGTFFGQGLGKIPLRNRALLGKWLWRYLRESTALWHQVILSIYGTHSNGWDANTLVRWSHCCPWKAIAQVFQDFSKYTRFVVGDGERIRFWEDLWWGDQIFKDQYPRLFRVVTYKNIPISSILGSARPFSWNFNFRRNLTDYEIEDLERLMCSLDSLSQMLDSSPFSPLSLYENLKSPSKLRPLVWLVAHKKVNTNDLLQLRRPHKALSPDICKLCMEQGESADHLFLHCSVTLGLWHRLFQLAKMDWVPPKSISDMMFINYKDFGKSKRGLVLWQNACIDLIWVVWRERNARIFEDKAKNSENLWDSIHFLASF
ncbi:putative ribonuclease H protein [Vitis vinifera]|uniref:Putative ribonuclease H protein n=1 Tax=Vitis vinifera TaxID=29760 RepID=A0A438EVW8_VITVI|nr:putative ribonuclease H protein [Vitis vinifera]